MNLSQLFILLIIFSLMGCSSNMNSQQWAKNIKGTEYVLKQDSLLINKNCILSDKISPLYGIQTVENYANDGIWTMAGCEPQVKHKLQSGEVIYILDISIRTDTRGSCWEVLAKNKDNFEFFIPSCKFHHPNLWVSPSNAVNMENIGFNFVPKYLTQALE